MKDMHELKALLFDELEEIQEKDSISFNDLQIIQMLTSSIKNIMRIEEAGTIHAEEVEEYDDSSDFLDVVSQAPTEEVMKVLNEHMDAIQLLHPKEYNIIMNKIKDLY